MAWPMLRTIAGTLITLIAFAFDPVFGIASTAISIVWIVLGIISVSKSDNHWHVHGVIAHVVTDGRVAAQASLPHQRAFAPHVPKQQAFDQSAANVSDADDNTFIDDQTAQDLDSGKIIECPRCSQFVFPSKRTCNCGWGVKTRPQPRQRVVERAESAPQIRELQPQTRRTQAPQRRTCPACPECRAPTVWASEFQRFFCARCDGYL